MRTPILFLVLLFSTHAFSVPRTQPLSQENPWDAGITPEARDQANALFKEGNQLLKDSVFVEAAAKYRQAIKIWDHPAIRYNLAKALFSLDQPVEIYQNILAAIKYGPESLAEDSYRHALEMKADLEKQIAKIEVSCAIEGAQVEMDGQPLFESPGKHSGWVKAGNHVFLAKKEGYVAHQISTSFIAGKETVFSIGLKTTEEMTEYNRRWSPKMPYIVMGAGTAVALTGGVLHLIGRSNVNSYNDYMTNQCGDNRCSPEEKQEYVDKSNRGEKLQKTAVATYIVGGAAVATGAVLWYLNRPQPFMRQYPAHEAQERPMNDPSAWEITPILTPQVQGLMASVSF
jgi:hypothetical protein